MFNAGCDGTLYYVEPRFTMVGEAVDLYIEGVGLDSFERRGVVCFLSSATGNEIPLEDVIFYRSDHSVDAILNPVGVAGAGVYTIG